MNFVETRIGQEICNKASRILGMMLKERKHYSICVPADSCSSYLDAQFAKGAKFIDKIYDGAGNVVIILEEGES